MKKYYVDSVKDIDKIYYFIRSTDDFSIIKEPSKYLKHKINQRRSPNTVRRIAYGISYYLNFMEQKKLKSQDVLEMKYMEQHEHFTEFLSWLKAGNHCSRDKKANNNTCNSYLQSVFGYYLYLILEYEQLGDLKVLEQKDISYSNAVGVRFYRSVQAFQGYLPKEESVGKTIEKDKIIQLLEASTSLRMQLMILLLAETGFRIGELLGVKYGDDIDYEKKTIRVEFRENNENGVRAKNAEYRRAMISDETFDLLMMYITENRALLAKTEYLFITLHGKTKGQPLTESAVYSALEVLEKRTGIKTTPHQLRHYFANERKKAGWELDKISAALGHKSIVTTEKYLHVTEDDMAEAMEQYYMENKGLYDIDKLL